MPASNKRQKLSAKGGDSQQPSNVNRQQNQRLSVTAVSKGGTHMKRFACVIGAILLPLVFSASIALAQSPLNPKALEAACAVAAKAELSKFRLPASHTKMWCAVIDREG